MIKFIYVYQQRFGRFCDGERGIEDQPCYERSNKLEGDKLLVGFLMNYGLGKWKTTWAISLKWKGVRSCLVTRDENWNLCKNVKRGRTVDLWKTFFHNFMLTSLEDRFPLWCGENYNNRPGNAVWVVLLSPELGKLLGLKTPPNSPAYSTWH